jgi:hypothetical protein
MLRILDIFDRIIQRATTPAALNSRADALDLAASAQRRRADRFTGRRKARILRRAERWEARAERFRARAKAKA